MSRMFCEVLENRQLLSAALPESAPLADPWGAANLMAAAKAKATAANVVGSYVASAVFDRMAGQFTLKITSQKRIGTLAGVLYSSDWGGLAVNITGSIAANSKMTLSGRNKTIWLKEFSAQASADGKTLNGSCAVVQMGILLPGTFNAKKSATQVPGPVEAKAPNAVGKYPELYSEPFDHRERISITITKQKGGRLWGKESDNDPVTGVVLENGEFRLIVRDPDGYREIFGKAKANGGMSGKWKWIGYDGATTASGTFSITVTQT